MEDFSIDKISELLSSPDLMKNVQSILGNLNNTQKEKPDIVVESNETNGLAELAAAMSSNGLLSSITSFLSQNKTERIALLSALRPFLSGEKQQILDSILQILKIANILTASNILK